MASGVKKVNHCSWWQLSIFSLVTIVSNVFMTYSLIFTGMVYKNFIFYFGVMVRVTMIISIPETVSWLVVFYGISILQGYLMPNPVYVYVYIKHIWFVTNLTSSRADKGVHTFLKGISTKVNLIERLEFEPKYYVAQSAGAVEYTDCTSAEG